MTDSERNGQEERAYTVPPPTAAHNTHRSRGMHQKEQVAMLLQVTLFIGWRFHKRHLGDFSVRFLAIFYFTPSFPLSHKVQVILNEELPAIM